MYKRINNKKICGLTGNALKIMSLIFMTIDHIGCEIFRDMPVLRIIGRLAFPIFAYMIAEGCTYTKNRKRYLLNIFLLALLCQSVYFVAMGSLYQCILVTFTLSIALIYALDTAFKRKNLSAILIAIAVFAVIAFSTLFLPNILINTDFDIDYGFFGVMLPVFVYFAKGRLPKLLVFSLAVSLVALYFSGIQWFSLLTIPIIAFYNGERGKMNIKHLFYIYYPLHLVVIYFIGELI